MAPNVGEALLLATTAIDGAEERPAQLQMAEAVGRAISEQRHLVVQAGTGTGKSLAYLVPALVHGVRVVISTATKALQDQLAKRDLPMLAERLPQQLGGGFEFAVLKGRSNYICRQRVAEIAGAAEQLSMGNAGDTSGEPPPSRGAGGPDAGLGPLGREVRRLVEWATRARTGDRAELSWEPSGAAWSQVSVGPRDCPGAANCPCGDSCFAELARKRAAEADVVVVNTHLYATHLAAEGEVLPPHDLVVFDEAHELEDIASASLGFELTEGRLHAIARGARSLTQRPAVLDAVDEAARRLGDALRTHCDTRLPRPLPAALGETLERSRQAATTLLASARQAGRAGEEGARRQRVLQAGTHLLNEIDAVLDLPATKVAWVEGPSQTPVLRVAPLDVAVSLSELLWSTESAPTAILTSATIPPRIAPRIGLPAGSYDELDVGSPFDYQHQALLYCAMNLPDPRADSYEAAMIEELVGLIGDAAGRTMALFTSWRVMLAAAEAVRSRVPWTVLTQAELPKPALVERFRQDEESCLFATMGFWQGVDIPGRALSLVVLDRLPFPRPDDPLLQARRELLGRGAFMAIDVPRAATLLAQGAGRLIRSKTDVGVVAVLDPRLGTARYRWDLIHALPPMRRTRHREEVRRFLTHLREGTLAQDPT